MSELKSAIGEFSEYGREFEGLAQKNQCSSENVSLYYERKDDLASQVMFLEQERKDLISRIALGDASPAELSEVNARLNRLKMELAEAEELHEAASNGQKSSAEQMREMQNGPMKRQKEIVWARVAEIEIEEATKSAIPQVKRAFIAYRRAGRARNFDDFMKETFRTVMFEEQYWGEGEIAMEQAIIKQHHLPFSR